MVHSPQLSSHGLSSLVAIRGRYWVGPTSHKLDNPEVVASAYTFELSRGNVWLACKILGTAEYLQSASSANFYPRTDSELIRRCKVVSSCLVYIEDRRLISWLHQVAQWCTVLMVERSFQPRQRSDHLRCIASAFSSGRLVLCGVDVSSSVAMESLGTEKEFSALFVIEFDDRKFKLPSYFARVPAGTQREQS